MDDAAPLTVAELMAALEAVRRRHGDTLPVVTADGAPVVRVAVWPGSVANPEPWVVLADRPGDG
jgi:hypothetical protein